MAEGRGRRAFEVVLGLLLGACVQVNEPGAPAVVIPEGDSTCSSFCECDAAEMTGRAFRLTRLEIDEPDAFAQILNTMWDGDVHNNVLNVIFHVDEAVQGSSTAFRSLKITAGPGWRDPKQPFILKAPEGEPTETAVTSYCLLEGLDVPITLKPYHGYQCQLKSTAPSALYFHSGPKDAPLICAPANEPANNIPISGLSIRASFNRDCSQIQDAFLEGCITVEAADGICMCATAGGCPMNAEPDRSLAGVDLPGYCHGACGEQWTSFGAIVRSFNLKPACLTPEGEPGYAVQGFFDAVAIPGQYNPTRSSDCTVGEAVR